MSKFLLEKSGSFNRIEVDSTSVDIAELFYSLFKSQPSMLELIKSIVKAYEATENDDKDAPCDCPNCKHRRGEIDDAKRIELIKEKLQKEFKDMNPHSLLSELFSKISGSQTYDRDAFDKMVDETFSEINKDLNKNK